MLCGVKPTVGSNPTATAKSADALPKVGFSGFLYVLRDLGGASNER